MLALGFGLTAAFLWAVHDLLARKLSQGVAVLPLVAVVLGAGAAALLPLTLMLGEWSAMTAHGWRMALLSGLAFAVAIGGLYKAFSLAPVRLVSPIIGAYPLLSLLIAAAQGRPITPGDWLAVLLIVGGIAIVAKATGDDAPATYAAPPAVAIGWSVLSAIGFAATFALAQEATRHGSDLPVMLVGRIVALSVVLAKIGWGQDRFLPPPGTWWILILMGILDAMALGAVTASGVLPKAEYAAISSSLFGVLTVLLATWFLSERASPVQWLGIATVFAGIAALGLQSL